MKYTVPENGQSPETGFDCSGFVRFVFKRVGFQLPENVRHANEFLDRFGVLVHWGCHKAGDLVLFSWGGSAPKHIGIVLDQNQYIHAPGKDFTKVSIEQLQEVPIINPVENAIYNKNPIAFKRPAVLKERGRWHLF